jgi:chromosome segregation ATPase
MGLLDRIDSHSDGLVPLSVKFIFTRLTSMRNCSVSISMVQVYRDDAFDLLNPKKTPAQIREDPETKVFFIPGLVIVPLEGEQQAIDLINAGLQLRTMAPQQLNPTSSRSHLILTFYLKKRVSADSEVVLSKLTFADLAGNERVSKSESKGLRLEEAKAINSSLSSLSEAICDLKNHNEVHLFRKSKLTKILQLSLMGQSYICILGMVRKSSAFLGETLATLGFVLRCRQIKMPEPPHCNLQDIHPEVANEEAAGSPSSQEFQEFSVFLGKCLLSMSRLLHKLLIDCAKFKTEDSEDQSQDGPSGTPMLGEHILQELSDSPGIPETLPTIQSCFKLLLEQIRTAQERVVNSGTEIQAQTQREKTEHVMQFNQQLHNFLKLLQPLLQKTLSQMLVGKFESLQTVSDARQAVSILHHFTEMTIGNFLKEVQECLALLIGDTPSSTFVSQLHSQIRNLFTNLTNLPSGQLTFSRLNLNTNCQDNATQTEEEKKPQQTGGISRYVQAEMPCRTISTQAEDLVLNKKVELLMQANKKLKSDCDMFLQEKSAKITTLQAQLDELQAKDKAVDTSSAPEIKARFEKLMKENVKLKDLVQEYQSEGEKIRARLEAARQETLAQEKENRALKENMAGLVKEFNQQKEVIIKLKSNERLAEQAIATEQRLVQELETMKLSSKQIQEQFRQAMSEAESQSAAQRNKIEALIAESKSEKQMGLQLKDEVTCLKQQINAADKQLEFLAQQKALAEEKLEQKIREDASKVAEAYSSRDEKMEKLADQAAQLEHLNAALNNEKLIRSDLEARLTEETQKVDEIKKKIIEKCNQKLQEVAAEAAKQMEKLTSKVNDLQRVIADLETELKEKDRVVRELTVTYNLSLDKKVQLEAELHSERLNLSKLAESAPASQRSPIHKPQLELLNTEVENLKGNIVALQTKLIESEDRLKDKAVQLEMAENKIKELSTDLLRLQDAHHDSIEQAELKFSQAVTQLEEELATNKVTLELCKTRLADSEETRQREKESYEKRLEDIQKNNTSDESKLRFELAAAKQDIGTKQATIEELEARLSESEETNRQSVILFEEHRARFEESDSTIRILSNENKSLIEGLKAHTDKIKEQANVIAELKIAQQEFQAKLDEAKRAYQLEKEQNEQNDIKAIDDKVREAELESLRVRLQSAESTLNEKEGLIQNLLAKAAEKVVQAKKAAEDYHTLEKEVIELRSMKKELIQISIQFAQAKEELTGKDKQIQKFATEIEGLQQSSRELEALRIRITSLVAALEIEKESKETVIKDLKDQHEQMLSSAKQSFEVQLQRKDERIAQLQLEQEHRHEDILIEKNRQIAHLESLLKQREEDFLALTSRHHQELLSASRRFESEILAAKAFTQGEITKILEEKNVLLTSKELLLHDLRVKDEAITKLRSENEALAKGNGEMEEGLQIANAKSVQLETVIEQLMTANKQLSAKLIEQSAISKNLYKKSQAILSKNTSGSKPDMPRGPSPVEKPLEKPEKSIATNLLSNFEKIAPTVPSLLLTGGPITASHGDKENTERNGQALSNRYASSNHHTRKSHPDRQPFEQKELPPSLPQIVVQQSSPLAGLAGLHTVGDDREPDHLRDELRMYSSRYSKASRGSRNSHRRSPTPSKAQHHSIDPPRGPSGEGPK